jgi:hypothetical protein
MEEVSFLCEDAGDSGDFYMCCRAFCEAYRLSTGLQVNSASRNGSAECTLTSSARYDPLQGEIRAPRQACEEKSSVRFKFLLHFCMLPSPVHPS